MLVDQNSSEFQRGMALYYLNAHRKELAFRRRLSDVTADALKERGCHVIRDSDGLCTVTSTVPFGRLMTSVEKRAYHWELVGGWIFFIMFFIGCRVVFVSAMFLGLGEGTATLWVLGWFGLSGIVFNLLRSKLPSVDLKDEAHSDERSILLYSIVIVLLFFGAGVLVHLVGWSGN